MRASPATSVNPAVQTPPDEFQVTDAEVEALSAATSDKSVPEPFAALFQCVAGFTPADSVAAIATPVPALRPPTKSILMITDGIAPSVPPVPVPPVPSVPAPSEPPVPRSNGRLVSRENGTSIPLSPGDVASARVFASTTWEPALPPVSVPPVPPVVTPPVPVPPVPPVVAPPAPVPPAPRSTGRLASGETGTSIAPSPDEVASATAPASGATFPAAPPVADTPPAPPVAIIPPVVVPPATTLPPAPAPAASGSAALAPPAPPVEDAGPSFSPASWPPAKFRVRFTQAANSTVAAIASGTCVNARVKFRPHRDYSTDATRPEHLKTSE